MTAQQRLIISPGHHRRVVRTPPNLFQQRLRSIEVAHRLVNTGFPRQESCIVRPDLQRRVVKPERFGIVVIEFPTRRDLDAQEAIPRIQSDSLVQVSVSLGPETLAASNVTKRLE